MSQLNIEIKARCNDPENIRKILQKRGADFKGIDHQTDTYFKVPNGRLKLREGNIEYSLVYYDREDISGPKRSDIVYYHPNKKAPVKELLSKALGKLITVKKKREIYYIDNIKFHIDEVEELGSFVEIEAIDETGSISAEQLYKQCTEYIELFKIKESSLLKNSYSDMLLEKGVSIKEGTIEQSVELSKLIPEFDDPYPKEEYEKHFSKTQYLILIAFYKNKPVGFKAGYEIDGAFYSWMGGVLPNFRNKHIAKKLAEKQQEWTKQNGFTKIKLKTKNKHKAMLLFALSDGFIITGFEEKENMNESNIILEKEL
jgi:predicted adenylyl cyclase CyaB